MPKKPKPDYYQPDEMDEILAALENAPLKWKTITYLLIDTGCRRGEILGLKPENVDYDTGLVVIDHALLATKSKGVYEGETKTGSMRAIRLAPQSLELLRKWKPTFLFDLRDIQAGNLQTGMLQNIRLDLGIGCAILKLRHIHIFQRELTPNLFRVDLALGKQGNRLMVCSSKFVINSENPI